MKENKYSLYLAILLSVVCILVTIFTFDNENMYLSWLNTLCQSVLAGTIVLIGTATIGYKRQKKVVLEGILKEINKLIHIFNEIEFFSEGKLLCLDEYAEYMKKTSEEYKNVNETEMENMHHDYIKNRIDGNKKILEKNMKKYINLSEYSIEKLWDMYGELDFFVNNKQRLFIYYEVYSYITEIFKKIKIEAYHFKIYFDATNGNIFVNWNKLINVQSEIFKKISQNELKYYQDVPHVTFLNENEEQIYINDAYYQLDKKYKIIWELTYNKNYGSVN